MEQKSTIRATHSVEIAGIARELPLFEVAPGVRIAVFNMLGDTRVVNAAAAAIADRLQPCSAKVIVTAEAKSIPLAHAMSAVMGLPYVVLRKTYKGYMGEALSAETLSITTGRKQTLFLDERDRALLADSDVLIIDDVISTGSTLDGMRAVVDKAGGTVAAIAAVFTEGDSDWSQVTALGNLPLFIDSQT